MTAIVAKIPWTAYRTNCGLQDGSKRMGEKSLNRRIIRSDIRWRRYPLNRAAFFEEIFGDPAILQHKIQLDADCRQGYAAKHDEFRMWGVGAGFKVCA